MAPERVRMSQSSPFRILLFITLLLLLAPGSSGAAITITPAALPNAQQNSDYSQQLTASGGSSPYTFAVTSGTLPTDMTLSGSGLLSGKTTQSGAFTFDVTATDSVAASGTQTYALSVCRGITFYPGAILDAVLNQPYSAALGAINVDNPLTFSIVAGALPAGITLGANGAISGTPTETGSFSFTVKVSDGIGCTASNPFVLDVLTGTSATNLVASPSSPSSIDLQWTDPQAGETDFRIERSLDGATWSANIPSVGGNTTSFTDSGRSAATAYFYRVIALSGAGDAPASNVAMATTDAASPLKVCRTSLGSSSEWADWPAASANDTNWAVAWSDQKTNNPPQIYFQLANKSDGAPIGTPRQISSSDMPARFPTLRWNGTNFGLLWLEHTRTPAGAPESRFAFALLDSAGNKTRGDIRVVSANASTVMNGNSQVPLVWDGGGWGVFLFENPEPSELAYYRLDADGDKLLGPVYLTTDSDWESNVAAAWNGSVYGVAYVRSRDNNFGMYFQQVDTSGTKVGPAVNISQNNGGPAMNQTAILWDGSGWAVAWREMNPDGSRVIFLQLLQADGTPKSAKVRISNDGGVNDNFPRLLRGVSGGYTIYVFYTDGGQAAEVGRLTASPSGARVGSRTTISNDDGLDTGVPPDAFSDGTNDLLFWTEATGQGYEMGLAVVNAAGGVVAGPRTFTSGHSAVTSAGIPNVIPFRGGFVVLWPQAGGYARIVDASGVATDRAPLFSAQPARRIAAVPLGNRFAAAWAANTQSGPEVGFQIFNSDGTSSVGPVVVSNNVNTGRGVAMDFSGEAFGLLWCAGRNLWFQRIDPNGTLIGPRVLVTLAAAGIGNDSQLQWIGSGWACVWRVSGELWYARLDAGGATLVAPKKVTSGTSAADQQVLWNGEALGLVWTDSLGFDPPGVDIYFTGLDGDGNRPPSSLKVVGTTYGDRSPSLYSTGDGFRVIYQDAVSGMREIEILSNGTIGSNRMLANHGEGVVASAWNGATAAMAWQHLERIFFQTSECLTDISPPPCPTLTATWNLDRISLSWNNVSDPESGILGWHLVRRGEIIAELDPDTLSFEDGGYTPNSNYTYSLRPMNGAYVANTTCPMAFAFAGIAISPYRLPGAGVGNRYSVQLSATGGTPPYIFAVTSGSLPPWLTLTADGLLSGTAALGTWTFTVTATDSTPATGTREYTLAICNPMQFGPTILATGYVGVPYTQSVIYSGGSPPVGFAITSGTLPAGLTFANNVISGTPTTAGSTPLTLTATDAIGCTASLNWTLVIESGAAVRNLRASPLSSSSIALAWTDPQKSETSFKIQRSLDGTSWTAVDNVSGNTTTYPDDAHTFGLSPATLYYYRVIAVTASGDTPPSNVTAATTFPATAAKICATQIEPDYTTANLSSVAFNGTQWAVVYQENSGIESEIWFRLLNRTTGNPAGTAVRVTTTDAPSRFPTLRWNGTNFGLVWNEAMRGPAGEPTSRLMFALLDSGGNKIRGDVPITNDVTPGFIGRDAAYPLVWDGAGWGVFAQKAVTEPADLLYYHLDPDGDVLHGPVTVAASVDWDGSLSAAWNGNEYGLAWTRQEEESVWFQRMQADGTLLSSPTKVFENSFKVNGGIGMTSIAWNGSGWAVAWAAPETPDDYFVSMRLIDSAGNLLGSAESRISDDFDLNGYTAADQAPTNDDLPLLVLKPGGGYIIYTFSFLNRTNRAEVGRLEANASGQKVGSRTILSADDGFSSQYHRVATDGTNYILVYNDTAQNVPEIGRALVSAAGNAVVAPATITSGHSLTGSGGSTTIPLGDGFATLWMEPTSLSTSVPYARIWDGAGTEVAYKAPLTTKNPRGRPSVAPFGDSFAIAYKEGVTNNVIFALFDGTGSQTGADVVVEPNASQAGATAMDFNGEAFGIAWIQGGRVNVRRVATDGTLLGSRVMIPAPAMGGGPLLMKWIGTGWAIVWRSPSDSEFWYALLDGSGATMVNPIQLTFSTAGNGPSDAQIAWSGSKFALVWNMFQTASTGQDVWYAIFGTNGIKDFPEKVLASTAWTDNNSTLTWQTNAFHVVYADGVGTLREISFNTSGTIGAGSRILSNRAGPNSTAWNGATLGVAWSYLGELFFETSACFDDTTTPPCPAVSGSFGAAGITLSWPAVTDAESGLFRYNVYRDGWMLAENFPSTRTLLDGGYTANATHLYEVRAMDAALRESSACATVPVFASTFPCGDVNGDNTVSPPDVIYLIDFLFAGGSAPGRGDVNGDGQTNVLDIFHLINYLFASGGAPTCM